MNKYTRSHFQHNDRI